MDETTEIFDLILEPLLTPGESSGRSDFALEDGGRLNEPMRYDDASDKCAPVMWSEAAS
jgi:hypothetical protein